MGVVKAYLQLKAVTATKQMASAHAMLRTPVKVSAGSPPSSHRGIRSCSGKRGCIRFSAYPYHTYFVTW